VKFLSHPRVETRISHTAKNRSCAVSLVRNDGVRFVLDQYAEFQYFVYSARSLKQQSGCRHVAPLGHIN